MTGQRRRIHGTRPSDGAKKAPRTHRLDSEVVICLTGNDHDSCGSKFFSQLAAAEVRLSTGWSPVANKVWTTVVEPVSVSDFRRYKEDRTDGWPYFAEDRPRTKREVED